MNKRVFLYFDGTSWVEVLSCELRFADPRREEYETRIIKSEPWRGMDLPAINKKELLKDAVG